MNGKGIKKEGSYGVGAFSATRPAFKLKPRRLRSTSSARLAPDRRVCLGDVGTLPLWPLGGNESVKL